MIRMTDCVDPRDDHPALLHPRERQHWPWQIFAEPALHVFAVACVLFQFANAALLPVALNGLTHRGDAPGILVSATIVVPQIIAALIAPWAGGLAQRIGRRPVLMAGFAAVPLRAVLFAVLPGALPLAVLQALDGVSAAVFGHDAAADRGRPDAAHRLPQPRHRRAWPGIGPGRHVQHGHCRLDRRSLRRPDDVPGSRRGRAAAVVLLGPRCRKPVPRRGCADAEKATLPA